MSRAKAPPRKPSEVMSRVTVEPTRAPTGVIQTLHRDEVDRFVRSYEVSVVRFERGAWWQRSTALTRLERKYRNVALARVVGHPHALPTRVFAQLSAEDQVCTLLLPQSYALFHRGMLHAFHLGHGLQYGLAGGLASVLLSMSLNFEAYSECHERTVVLGFEPHIDALLGTLDGPGAL